MEEKNSKHAYIKMDYGKIRENIRQKILERNLSIAKVERLANINLNVLRHFLKEINRSIDLELIFKLATFFECNWIELIEGTSRDKDGEKKISTEAARENVVLKAHLLKETCDYILEYIQQHHLNVSSAEVFLFIEKIYYFSWKKAAFDKDFADWYIDEYLKRGKK